MPTTVRLDPRTERLLKRLARKTGRTKSQIIRDAIEKLAERDLGLQEGATPYEKIAHLAGIARGGPPDLSERTGEKVSRMLAERTKRDSR